MVIITDNESAAPAMARAIKESRTQNTHIESVPRYSSSSPGAAERANRETEGQIRALRGSAEEK